jgi:hypothetical protein
MAKKGVKVASPKPKAESKKSYDFELSPALQGKYELRNTHCERIHFDGQWYDFRTMDLATAERLVAKTTTFLYPVN